MKGAEWGAYLLDAIRPVIDPEIGFSVVDIGLIRGIEWSEQDRIAKVRMTLTSPYCPYGPVLREQVLRAVESLPEVEECEVEMELFPIWDARTEASEEVKATLGIWD